MEDKTQQMSGFPDPLSGATQRMNVPPVFSGDPMAQPTAMGMSVRALEMEVIIGNQFAEASRSSRLHQLVLLKSSGTAIARRMPLNVCLAIDRSGSMEGEPLEYAKRACEYVVDLLETNDILSIVTFEEHVEVVMPARRVVNKNLIKQHIHRIIPGNTTNLYDGLMHACMQVASVNATGYVNRVLILTDGEPTTGIKDFNSIVQHAADNKMRGITVTALGFGSEYNEELMAGIARRGSGNYYYISQPALIPEIFRKELETLMTITARNVRVRFSFPRGVQCRYVYGVAAPSITARGAEFVLPDIERGCVVANLSELELDRHVPGTYRVVKVEVSYEDTCTGKTETLTGEGVVEFVTDPSRIQQGVNPMVQSELDVHLATRNLEKTMMGMRTQQLTAMGALSDLQRTRNILLQSGKLDQAQEVTQAIDALQSGGDAEKTLIGTIYSLDKGKRKA